MAQMNGQLGAMTCMTPGGYSSFAAAFIPDGCAPGTIPAGCKAPRRYTITLAAGASDIIIVDPFQPLKVGAIVSVGAVDDGTIDDLQVNAQSLFPRVDNDGGAGDVVAGLGDVDFLTPELYRSGLNPLPPQPAIDKQNPLSIFVSSAGGAIIDVLVYFVNP